MRQREGEHVILAPGVFASPSSTSLGFHMLADGCNFNGAFLLPLPFEVTAVITSSASSHGQNDHANGKHCCGATLIICLLTPSH
eukprot:1057348-Amphidinium_carterae.1